MIMAFRPAHTAAMERIDRDGRPIGWDGFPASTRSREPYTRYTGHLPPLQQIAGQVRSAFGFTQGHAGPDGPALEILKPVWTDARRGAGVRQPRAAAEPAVAPRRAPTGYSAKVYEFLQRLAYDDADLPPVPAIAAHLDLPGIQVHAAFGMLHKAGHIDHIAANPHRIIRLTESGATLRTAGAPDLVPA